LVESAFQVVAKSRIHPLLELGWQQFAYPNQAENKPCFLRKLNYHVR
jgi:hypothetical protein